MDTPNQKLAIGRLLNIFGPWFGLVLVVGLFSLSNEVRPYFLTGANFNAARLLDDAARGVLLGGQARQDGVHLLQRR